MYISNEIGLELLQIIDYYRKLKNIKSRNKTQRKNVIQLSETKILWSNNTAY